MTKEPTLKVSPLNMIEPDRLKFIDANRPPSGKHIAKLKAAIQADNQLHIRPIVINTKYEIIDGQHRVLAAKELGLERIPCLVVLAGIEAAQTINQNTKNWDSAQFAHYWAKQGKKDYADFIEFCQLTGIKQSVAITLLSGHGHMGSSGHNNNFKTGLFKVKNIEYVYRFIDRIGFFKKWLGEDASGRAFLLAIWKVYNHPLYNHTRMEHKAELVGLNKVSDRLRYVQQLEAVYNWKVKVEERIKFV